MAGIIYGFLLEFARAHVHAGPLERVLESLSDSVGECRQVISRARETGDEDYLAGVADDESDVVESLVGAALVTTQTQITAIVSRVMRIHEQAKSDGHKLSSSDGKRDGIMRLGSAILGITAFSRIEVIDASANFFKHHYEWEVPWDRLERHQRKAADVMKAVGGSEGCTGNLRTALAALDIDYDMLSLLHREVTSWARKVVLTYEKEIESQGLMR